MGLETAANISDLNPANPAGTDPKAQGDDHIRLIKSVLKKSFAGFPGAVICTGSETQGAGPGDYVVSVSPTPAAYASGLILIFKATHANTGAATLSIAGLAVKALKDPEGGALAEGDVPAGAMVCAVYDGADFLLISPTDRAARSGDVYGGVHDFAAAVVQVASQGAGDNSARAANTAYVDAADALKADKASPVLTGVPRAPTATPGTQTDQIATTAFVQQQAFQTALPVQAGNGGRFLTTNGVNASWGGAFVGDGGSGGAMGLVPAPAVGEARAFLCGDGDWRLPPSGPDVIAQEQKPSTVNGSAFPANTWKDRELNTLIRNEGSLASLIVNGINLSPGTWRISGRAGLSFQVNGGATAKISLLNATSAVRVAFGEQCTWQWGGTDTFVVGPILHVVAVVVISVPSTIKLQTYCSAPGLFGWAQNTGDPESYATLEATRIVF